MFGIHGLRPRLRSGSDVDGTKLKEVLKMFEFRSDTDD